MTLQHSHIERLSRLLGMTGSNHDGEALNAIRAANAMLQKHRLTWPEVLLPSEPPEAACNDYGVTDHRREAEAILAAHRASLTAWEVDFLAGILGFQQLQPKQVAILAGIRKKVAAGN